MASRQGQQSTRFQLFTFVATTTLSFVLPAGLIFWSITQTFAEKPFGLPSTEIHMYFRGSVKDGELWYAVAQFPDRAPWATKLSEKRIRVVRLNLETGIKQETGLTIDGDWGTPLWIGDELFFYVHSTTSLFEQPLFQCLERGSFSGATLLRVLMILGALLNGSARHWVQDHHEILSTLA
jgi:hypothetical protein